jgi:hypothetical protein
MAAMKPRTGDGPMEAVKEGRLIIVRVPLEGGGRLVVSVNDAEAPPEHDPHADGRSSDRPFRVASCSVRALSRPLPAQSVGRVVSWRRPSPTIESAPITAGEACVSWMRER